MSPTIEKLRELRALNRQYAIFFDKVISHNRNAEGFTNPLSSPIGFEVKIRDYGTRGTNQGTEIKNDLNSQIEKAKQYIVDNRLNIGTVLPTEGVPVVYSADVQFDENIGRFRMNNI